MAQSKRKKSPQSLCIGTWNVHNWYDGNGKQNMSRIIQSLHQTPVDCLGLQEVLQWGKLEVGQNKQDINEMKKCLDFDYLSTDQMNGYKKSANGFYHGVAMLSKYRIISSYAVTERLQLNMIQFNKNVMIGIIVAHFDHREENKRIEEYKTMSQLIANNQNLPLVFIGDFNALTRSDYTDSEWERITKIREDDQWELPKTDLITLIKKDNAFMDSLYVYRDSQSKNTDDDEKGEEFMEISQITEESDSYKNAKDANHDQKEDAMDESNPAQESTLLNGVKWEKLLGRENLGTCAFDTRIDYVMANQKMINLFDVVEYQHLAHDDASDHKLVRIRFQLKSKISNKD